MAAYEKINQILYDYFEHAVHTPLVFEYVWPNANLGTILFDTASVDPQCATLCISQPWLLDYHCNNWYFMISLSALFFEVVTDYSFFPVELNFNPYFRTSFELSWLCSICDFDIAKSFFLPSLNIFIVNSILYTADYFWLEKFIYKVCYVDRSLYWFKLNVPMLHEICAYKNAALLKAHTLIEVCFALVVYIYDFLMSCIYNLGYKLEPLYVPRLTWYLFWIVRGFLAPLWLCCYIFLFFYFFYFLHICHRELWYERLGYWLEYFDLRIWRKFERSYYSTCELNTLYSWNYNHFFRQPRAIISHIIYVLVPGAQLTRYLSQIGTLFKVKKLPLALEWYSKIYIQRKWNTNLRLTVMFPAFLARFIFTILWAWFTIMWRFIFSLLIRYAAILHFLHFYIYLIFYGITWCWWIFSREYCYNYDFL